MNLMNCSWQNWVIKGVVVITCWLWTGNTVYGQATKPTGPALAPIYAARGVKSEDNWDMAEFQPFSGGDVARAQGDGLMFDALWTFKIADSAE
jgi:hypothetical protein